MSGFCGIINLSKKPVEIEEIASMFHKIEISAVDRSELWAKDNIGLGHKLNYFTPESFYEKLPFYDSIKGIAITADTRIDNREDLAKKLGIRLSLDDITTDSQLIILAYEKWGVEFANHLIGDFSIVIWDEKQQQVILTTDHFGHYPIYYHFDKGQLIFASELKSIHSRVNKGINPNKIVDLLIFENFYEDKESTYLKDVLKVEPATSLIINTSSIKKHVHWELDITKRLPYKKESDLVEAFQEVMFQSVGDRIRTNFPVSTMLSGGLDSSAITAVAANILKKQNRELFALAGVLPESSKPTFTDERVFIDEFKSFENVKIKYLTAEGLGPFSGMEKKLALTFSPNFSTCHFMYDAISNAAQECNARVVLDGLYGELGPSFHGRSYWVNLFKNKRYGHLRKELLALGQELNHSPWRLFARKVIRPILRENKFPLMKLKGEDQRNVFYDHFSLTQKFIDRYIGKESKKISKLSAAYLQQTSSSMREEQILNMVRSQVGDWPYMDDNHIQHASPFSDRRMIEFALAAPSDFKVHNGWNRYMIRAGMEGIIPKSIQWRKTKAPFVPDYVLRYNAQREEMQERLNATKFPESTSEIFDIPQIINFLSNELPIPNKILSKTDAKSFAANSANTMAIKLLHLIQIVEEN